MTSKSELKQLITELRGEVRELKTEISDMRMEIQLKNKSPCFATVINPNKTNITNPHDIPGASIISTTDKYPATCSSYSQCPDGTKRTFT
jgi:hypothetical protein